MWTLSVPIMEGVVGRKPNALAGYFWWSACLPSRCSLSHATHSHWELLLIPRPTKGQAPTEVFSEWATSRPESVSRFPQPRLWGLWGRIVFRQFLTYAVVATSKLQAILSERFTRMRTEEVAKGSRLSASYATVGYGDVVLPQMWRTLGPVESIIGVLMCGLSASFLFAIVTRLVEREARVSVTPATDTGNTSPGTTIRQSISRLLNANF